MKPATSIFGEDLLPVYVSWLELRNRGMAAVRATHSGPQAKASLREVQAISDLPPHTVIPNPLEIGLVYTTLIQQVLNQSTDLIVCQRSHDSAIQPKATL